MQTPTSATAHGANACPHCAMAMPAGVLAGLCPACLLKQGAAGDTGLLAAFTPPSLEELTPLLPQLEILSLIGSGGMGAVYKARQRELDRIVALKILPPGIGDQPGFAERFTQEAKALAKLNHPGIVTIHDTGRVDGLYFLLMEYVDGLNLRQLIEAGRITSREALAIVPQICDALQYAHDAGIVHRDIKPENILLDRQGRVKVADFGLAKLVGVSEERVTQETCDISYFTQAGMVMGTPQYMAPEQIEQSGDVDHRADIYSLGVVLYQMLTGELPGQQLEAPSRKVQIDVRLDEVVLRALEKNPEHRYQQASQVKQIVETIITLPNPYQNKQAKAMDIKFNCHQCGQKLSVGQTAAGAEVSCPQCTTTLLVPLASASGTETVPIPPILPPRLTSLPPSVPTKRAKGIAIWSLVLSIIGVIPIIGLATGIFGLACGITALVKKTTSKGLAISGTVVGAIAALMIPFHIIIYKNTRSVATFVVQTETCTNNLRMIGVGIAQYRQTHNGQYPANLKDLEKEGIISAKALHCPLHQGNSGIGSYDYIRPSGTETRGIIAWDRSPHRAMGKAIVGRNVLYADLSVRYLTEDEFRKAPKAVSASVNTPPRNVTSTAPSRPSSTPPPMIPTRPPVEEPMTITRALESLKSPGTDRRGLLRFLAESNVEAERRDDVIDAVAPLLKDVEWEDAAFQVFIRWADKEQVPELIEFIRVAPTSARSKESMKVLSRLGDARAAEPLAACLTEFHVARDAKAALAAMGDLAKPAVLPLYHHENRGVQEAARELLRGYNATEDEIKSESLKALANSSAGTRRSAVEFFSKATLTEAQRVAVAKAMHTLVTDPDKGVADATRRALKTLATKADADFLLEKMNSTDDALRVFATDILVDLKDVRVAKPLAAMLQDRMKTHYAGNALIRLGSSAEPSVLALLSSEDPTTRKRAAEVLANIGTSASLPALQRATKDKDFFAKVAADRALNAIKARPPEANRK